MRITASTVSLTVEDVAASSEFLSRHFGFRVEAADENNHFAKLGREDAGLAIVFLRRGVEVLPRSYRDRLAAGVIVAFTTRGLEAEERRLREEGVTVTMPPREDPWGERSFQVTDPNGVVIQLVEWVNPETAEPRGDADAFRVDWDSFYRNGDAPWETGQPSEELRRVVAEEKIRPCRAIELGCGTGENAVWLARQGFDVTAVDVSPLAIEKARRRAASAGVKVRFAVADVLEPLREFGTFAFVFDRGCYHVVRDLDARAYLDNLRRITEAGSSGLILAGNAREPHPEGPPAVSAEDLRAELEPTFEIVRLREFHFDRAADQDPRYLAWSCLIRRVGE